MNYLYHRVPQNLKGNILYPLNTLKEIHPVIYEEQIRKYTGREHVTKFVIPVLNCLWNDVLHFSSVHPRDVKSALIDAGRNPEFVMTSYQVDPKLIHPDNAIVYLYDQNIINSKPDEEKFVPFDPDDTGKYSVMPQATKDYYIEMIAKGEGPLLYHRIPHILYKGTLDVNKLSVVSV
ncbi:MAG TPA: hypothetical protein PKD83_04625 [Ignavibacteria bacterium]|nr:hypothetical protein [Ignavibacteria bacterium]